jgi:hypothetical protein
VRERIGKSKFTNTLVLKYTGLKKGTGTIGFECTGMHIHTGPLLFECTGMNIHIGPLLPASVNVISFFFSFRFLFFLIN